jgi:uncharacterized damage-inducible protein DinB
MKENFLLKLFEHNNWANGQVIHVCCGLSAEQLDAKPSSATHGTIRETLVHLVSSQEGYLALLTLPPEQRPRRRLEMGELEESARRSGEGLLAMIRGEIEPIASYLQTRDCYLVEPWVVMVQIINHATEHREQISSMLTGLGVVHPYIDGWDYGDAVNAVLPMCG